MSDILRILQEAWSRWWVGFWVVAVSLPLLLDMLAALDRNPRSPTLTSTIIAYIPWWVTMAFISWLWLHFGSRYAGRPVL